MSALPTYGLFGITLTEPTNQADDPQAERDPVTNSSSARRTASNPAMLATSDAGSLGRRIAANGSALSFCAFRRAFTAKVRPSELPFIAVTPVELLGKLNNVSKHFHASQFPQRDHELSRLSGPGYCFSNPSVFERGMRLTEQ
ncbi:hypothetical protein [Methylobacterium iners]|uniref:hypothetical protein n=1 Tax=Methylobacterium iners TaxID=418707 RepID=UPI001EE1D4B2|nr:hypothetical protein [Methylobacterium iners]